MFTLIRMLVFGYVGSLVGVYLMTLLVDALAPRHGGEKNQVQALKAVAYSATPMWLVGVLRIVPGAGYVLWIVEIAALVMAFRLLRQGLVHTMKVEAQQAGGYAGQAVAVAVVAGLVVAAISVGVGGVRQMARKTAPSTSSLSDDDQVKVDPASPLGKLQSWSKNMEQAGKKMDDAQKTGDPDAQQKAVGQMMGALFGDGDQVESLDPERLKAFLPEKLSGLTRASFSSERNAAMGLQVSEAQASYGDAAGHMLDLDVTDAGGAKGMMMFASWAMLQQERQTDHGYEKSTKKDGRLVHEEWDTQENRGEYSMVIADRFVVKVSGQASGIDQLRSAVESLDIKGLEALKGEGVKKSG